MEVAAFIYGLKDPRTAPIRYVGQTSMPWMRLKTHVYETKSIKQNAKNLWVKGMLNEGVKPEMVILETTPYTLGGVAEVYWQEKLNLPSNKLLNKAKGSFVPQPSWEYLIRTQTFVPFEKTCKENNLDIAGYKEYLLFKNDAFFMDLQNKDLWVTGDKFSEFSQFFFTEFLKKYQTGRIKFSTPAIKKTEVA